MALLVISQQGAERSSDAWLVSAASNDHFVSINNLTVAIETVCRLARLRDVPIYPGHHIASNVIEPVTVGSLTSSDSGKSRETVEDSRTQGENIRAQCLQCQVHTKSKCPFQNELSDFS